jgi:hypothetical protein
MLMYRVEELGSQVTEADRKLKFYEEQLRFLTDEVNVYIIPE